MTTIGQYLVNIYKYEGSKSSFFSEGICLIIDKKNNKYLQVENKENLLGELLLSSDKIRFTKSHKENMELIIDLRTINRIGKIGISFDKSSSSAFTKFVTDIEKYVNTKFGELYYPSGFIRYIGPIKNGLPEGKNGIEYYDLPGDIIKFEGEFEEGVYDGTGIFYSKCGSISLKVNNLTNGVPYDFGTIRVRDEKHQVDFNNLNNDYDFKDDQICYKIAKIYFKNLNELLFDSLSVEKKLKVLMEKMQKMEIEINELKNKSTGNSGGFLSGLFYN